MKKAKKFLTLTLQEPTRFKSAIVVVTLLWYSALFPGRLGFDSAEAIRMMQRGESTNWWTGSFWWFLKLSSLNGTTIALSSLISIFVLCFALYYFCESLDSNQNANRLALLIFLCSPIYGGFGVNIGHDVFAASGIIIFTAFHIRAYRKYEFLSAISYVPVILAGVLVITTQYGIFMVVLNAILLLFKRRIKLAITLLLVPILIIVITSIGVTHVRSYGPLLFILGDIKCVAQHPEAEITDKEWTELESLAPRNEWEAATKCSLIDDQLRAMPSLDLDSVRLSSNLTRTYFGIFSRNSAIFAMAHFQRASIALPPPFFHGPKNQVTLDSDLPIGLGTNTALQSQAGVLHPSIDEPSVNKKPHLLKVLEIPAQGLIFIVNQATWFWGWGGLWLWPFLAYLLFFVKRENGASIAPILSTTVLLHILLLVLSAPLPRYVMGTIVIGNYLLLVMLVKLYKTYIQTEEKYQFRRSP